MKYSQECYGIKRALSKEKPTEGKRAEQIYSSNSRIYKDLKIAATMRVCDKTKARRAYIYIDGI